MKLLARTPVLIWALLLVAVPHVWYAAAHWFSVPFPAGQALNPDDPDSWLRLTLVREWLQGGGWYGHGVPRTNAPYGGITSPWTRPLDMVIAVLSSLQPAADISTRLVRTALLLPLLWSGLLVYGVSRACTVLSAERMAPFFAAVLFATAPLSFSYFGLANADHHALLACLFVLTVGNILPAQPSRGALLVGGVLLGLQLWISPESLVLIGALYGWFGLRWLLGDLQAIRPLALLASSTAFMTALALCVEYPPAEWATARYDTLSVVHVGLLVATALGAWSLVRVTRQRLAAGLSRALMVLGVMWASYPRFFLGSMAEVDPFIFAHFLPNVYEAQPFYKVATLGLLGTLVQPVAALLVLWLAYRRLPLFSAMHCRQLAYLLLVTGVLYAVQQRFYYYFYPMALLVLAPYLAALFRAEGMVQRRVPLLMALIFLPLGLMALSGQRDASSNPENSQCQLLMHQLVQAGALEGITDRPLTVLTSNNLGADMLFFTQHRIVASNYHREGAGLRYLRDVSMETDIPALKRKLDARQIDLIFDCAEAENKGTALYRLLREEARVDWLRPVPYTLPPLEEGTPAPTLTPRLMRVVRPGQK